MLSSLCSCLGWIHPPKDSLRGRHLSSLSRDHVSVEEAGPDNPGFESEKPNQRAELKDVSRKEEEKGEDTPGVAGEVRSDESGGRRKSEDVEIESQEGEEEEEKKESEGSIGSFGDDDSFTSESEKAHESQGGGKDTEGAEPDEGSDPSEPGSAAGESSQGGGEVCESRTARDGPSKTLDQGGRMKTGRIGASPSAEVGLGVGRVPT